MKKAYMKPEIVFESFSMSTNIAAGCEVQTDTPSENACGVLFSGLNVFLEGMQGCEDFQVKNEGGDGRYGNLCYHIPTGEQNLFTS